MTYLERIKTANDIKKIPERELPTLAAEVRDFLIESVSHTGGHLASNLGVVELTIALHRVYGFPKDKLVWDVGHQAYTHKLLTGRRDAFAKMRQEEGMSGFPRREESDCDCFDSGHSSNSISAGLGYVRARDLQKRHYSVVSVIGDGALTGGQAYEAINNAATLKTNFVIVLNDNEMSISKNVGGISRYLGELRTSSTYRGLKTGVQKGLEKIPRIGEGMVKAMRRTKSSLKQLVIPGMWFEDMGLTYLGPVDGHNIPQIIRVLREAKRVAGPVVVHVRTRKGEGYEPAKKNPEQFHGTGAFDIETGEQKKKGGPTYTAKFSEAILELAEKDPKIVAVTAAMREGTGLKEFAKRFPERFFDVGIAEGHGVTFSAGLALGGLTPVYAVYSSFLQRGFDQVMEDVCMQKLHVILAIDRAGLVGGDGRTHQGCFDLSYLLMMPNMTVMAPKDGAELGAMLEFAAAFDGPVALRYPRGEAWVAEEKKTTPIEYGKAEVLQKGERIALLAVGEMVRVAFDAAETLRAEGFDPTVVNMRFAKPIDEELLRGLAADHEVFVTMEENAKAGGFGEEVLRFVNEEKRKTDVRIAAVPDDYVRHGSVSWQREQIGLDAASIAKMAAAGLRAKRTKKA